MQIEAQQVQISLSRINKENWKAHFSMKSPFPQVIDMDTALESHSGSVMHIFSCKAVDFSSQAS